MSRQSLYTFLFFALPLVYFFSLPIETGDLAIWVAHGKSLILTGKVLRHDIFSVLPTSDLIYPLGTSFVYALIYNYFDLIGVSFFHKLCLLIILSTWYQAFVKERNFNWNLYSIVTIFLSLYGCSFLFIDRPALVAMLPFIFSFIVLQKKKELTLKDYILLIMINVFWVNLHGSWPVLSLMFAYRQFVRIFGLKKDDLKRSLIWIAIILLSTLINPFGAKVFKYVVETAVISKARHIDEWGSTFPAGAYNSQVWAFYFLILVLFICLIKSMKVSKEKLLITLSSPIFCLVVLGMQSVRNTAWPFFVFPLFIVNEKWIDYQVDLEVKKPIQSKANLFIFLSVAAIFIAFIPTVKPHVQSLLPKNKKNIFSKTTPLASSAYLNRTTDNFPVFNEWELGSYLILKQKHPIFIDTRNIIYGEKEFNLYQEIINAKNSWEINLNNFNIHYVLLSKASNQPLLKEIALSSNWKNVLEEEDIILFSKK